MWSKTEVEMVWEEIEFKYETKTNERKLQNMIIYSKCWWLVVTLDLKNYVDYYDLMINDTTKHIGVDFRIKILDVAEKKDNYKLGTLLDKKDLEQSHRIIVVLMVKWLIMIPLHSTLFDNVKRWLHEITRWWWYCKSSRWK